MNTMQGWAFKGLHMGSDSFSIGWNTCYIDAHRPIGKVKGSDLYPLTPCSLLTGHNTATIGG
jgi:hypothetical protein